MKQGSSRSVNNNLICHHSETLLSHSRRIEKLRRDALAYPAIDLNSRQLNELELLLSRSFYPLAGYLDQENYETVLARMRLADGTLWPLPVCLDVSGQTAQALTPGQPVAINDREGFMLAVLTVTDIWQPDKKKEALALFGTADPTVHPGVRIFLEETGSWYLGGSLEGIHLPFHYDFNELRLSPSEVQRFFSRNGWRQVIGFHAEDFLHRSHREMILRAAREVGANIFLQPMVGSDHPENIDHYTLVRCYQRLIEKFPRNMVILGLLPKVVRRAGPREALWQAIIKKNYGCSHFPVAEDHADPWAGAADGLLFYKRHAARELVGDHEKEIGIRMVPLDKMFYVEARTQYLPAAEITPEMGLRDISAEELARRLENDLEIPGWFTYPEVLTELRHAFPPRHRQGFTIFITGLSGSGKSTLAKVLMIKFLEMRTRPVTLLDGDIVRRNLSSELSFSAEHRNLNITRIGFVASEITKNGGIAICAPIAPHEEARQANRRLIGKYGGYIEVYMATPRDVCEQRDRKGLYAKARAGMITAFTGVSAPYTPPANAEVVIDTSHVSPAEAAQEVLLYLEEQGYIR
jgi:sulfate adenylyltransferase